MENSATTASFQSTVDWKKTRVDIGTFIIKAFSLIPLSTIGAVTVINLINSITPGLWLVGIMNGMFVVQYVLKSVMKKSFDPKDTANIVIKYISYIGEILWGISLVNLIF